MDQFLSLKCTCAFYYIYSIIYNNRAKSVWSYYSTKLQNVYLTNISKLYTLKYMYMYFIARANSVKVSTVVLMVSLILFFVCTC